MRLATAIIAASLLLIAPAAAQQDAVGEKQIALPAEQGLVVGHQARQGRAILVELVPSGETVQNFSRMVTLQTAPGLGAVPENAYLDEFAKRYSATCRKTNLTNVTFGEKGAKGIRLDCPRHPQTGKLETVFLRVIDLGKDLATVQITMRFLPMPADGAWARDYLTRVAVE